MGTRAFILVFGLFFSIAGFGRGYDCKLFQVASEGEKKLLGILESHSSDSLNRSVLFSVDSETVIAGCEPSETAGAIQCKFSVFQGQLNPFAQTEVPDKADWFVLSAKYNEMDFSLECKGRS